MQKKRFSHIDIIEVIAVFFVLLYHCTLFSYDFLEESTPSHYILYFSRTILSTCVPLFFFANGYLLFGKDFDLRKHVLKIVKLTILTGIWAILTLCTLSVIKGEYFSITEFIKALWTWKQGWINHLWYMGALICIYLFFPLLKNAYDKNIRLFFYFTIISAIFTIGNTSINQFGTICADLILGKSISLEGHNFFNIFNPFRGIRGFSFAFFCMGGVAYHYQNEIERISVRKRNVFSILGILVSCLGLFATGYIYSKINGSIWDVVWNGYDTLFTLINVICIYLLSLNWKKDCRIIRTISSNTLGVYFIHSILIALLRPFIQRYDFLLNPAFNLFFCGFILAACVVLCLILRKCPVLSKLVQ